jgi:chaperone modulatory protein CbpM
MITLDILIARFGALRPDDLQRWIAEGYVRPALTGGEAQFDEIDVERLRLILDLRDRLAVDEQALPVVLSLLDQVYALRRKLRAMGVAE